MPVHPAPPASQEERLLLPGPCQGLQVQAYHAARALLPPAHTAVHHQAVAVRLTAHQAVCPEAAVTGVLLPAAVRPPATLLREVPAVTPLPEVQEAFHQAAAIPQAPAIPAEAIAAAGLHEAAPEDVSMYHLLYC